MEHCEEILYTHVKTLQSSVAPIISLPIRDGKYVVDNWWVVNWDSNVPNYTQSPHAFIA